MTQDLYNTKRSLELDWQQEHLKEGKYTLNMGLIDKKIQEIVKEIINYETKDIIATLGDNDEVAKRYKKSAKIAMKWIKNYTEYDFRSLGTYTRKELDKIASEEDAF